MALSPRTPCTGPSRHGNYHLFPAHQIFSARPYTDYKNKRGHLGVIAGSEGMLGAARLCEAALRAGAGLVTLHVHRTAYPVAAACMPPEIMVKPVDSYADISIRPFSAFLLGPGIGSVSEEDAEAIRIILETGTPVLLDADGLNLAAAMQWKLGKHILATPHHGEIRRLLPEADDCAIRADIADCFLAEHEALSSTREPAALLRKGQAFILQHYGRPGHGDGGTGRRARRSLRRIHRAGESLLVSAVLGTYLCGRGFGTGHLQRSGHPAKPDRRRHPPPSACRTSFHRTPLLLMISRKLPGSSLTIPAP